MQTIYLDRTSSSLEIEILGDDRVCGCVRSCASARTVRSLASWQCMIVRVRVPAILVRSEASIQLRLRHLMLL